MTDEPDASAPRPQPVRGAVPPGRLVYAVGDVHGRADLLADLLGMIRADADRVDAARRTLVFLGDYIDRGPDSARVVDLALSAGGAGFDAVCLKGNHEQIMLDVLADAAHLPLWLLNGAAATLGSYGVDAAGAGRGAMAAERVRAALLAALPPSHRAFLDGLALNAVIGDYFFVHAGVRPRVALDRQSERDCLWIRDEFLLSGAAFGKIVVHGHTPGPEPVVRPNRIGIDTMAWSSGRLTALRLWGEAREFLSTIPP